MFTLCVFFIIIIRLWPYKMKPTRNRPHKVDEKAYRIPCIASVFLWTLCVFFLLLEYNLTR